MPDDHDEQEPEGQDRRDRKGRDHKDRDHKDMDPVDERKAASLPPGADTKGDPTSTLRGSDRDRAPYEEAPAEGRLAPDADNPPP